MSDLRQKIEKSESWVNTLVASIASLLFLTALIFYSREVIFPEVEEGDEQIQFLDIEQVEAKKRKAKKEISTEAGETSEDDSKETGSFDADNFVDIDYLPNVNKPNLIGRLKIKHPQAAKENNVEATAHLRIFISKHGEIKRIKIFRIKLSKQVSPILEQKLKSEFREKLLRALRGKRYQPAILNGKAIAVRSEQTIKMALRE